MSGGHRSKLEMPVIDAELEQRGPCVWRAYNKSSKESEKQECYAHEQCDLLRALEDVAATERTIYELDNRKDQVMAVCKLALAIIVMWTRDHYFPATYTHATWARLAPSSNSTGVVVSTGRILVFSVRVTRRPILCEQKRLIAQHSVDTATNEHTQEIFGKMTAVWLTRYFAGLTGSQFGRSQKTVEKTVKPLKIVENVGTPLNDQKGPRVLRSAMRTIPVNWRDQRKRPKRPPMLQGAEQAEPGRQWPGRATMDDSMVSRGIAP